MSHDPEAIRVLTQTYPLLRGLEQVPLALALLGTQLAVVSGFRPYPLVFVVLAALSLPAMRVIRRYYDRRFGVVQVPGWGARTWTIIVITFFALQFVSKQLALPIHLGFLAAAIAYAVYALRNFELQGQHMFLAIFLVGASVWPPLDPDAANDLWRNAFGLGFATVWILMGFWDHRTLVKAFERARLADIGRAPSSTR